MRRKDMRIVAGTIGSRSGGRGSCEDRKMVGVPRISFCTRLVLWLPFHLSLHLFQEAEVAKAYQFDTRRELRLKKETVSSTRSRGVARALSSSSAARRSRSARSTGATARARPRASRSSTFLSPASASIKDEHAATLESGLPARVPPRDSPHRKASPVERLDSSRVEHDDEVKNRDEGGRPRSWRPDEGAAAIEGEQRTIDGKNAPGARHARSYEHEDDPPRSSRSRESSSLLVLSRAGSSSSSAAVHSHTVAEAAQESAALAEGEREQEMELEGSTSTSLSKDIQGKRGAKGEDDQSWQKERCCCTCCILLCFVLLLVEIIVGIIFGCVACGVCAPASVLPSFLMTKKQLAEAGDVPPGHHSTARTGTRENLHERDRSRPNTPDRAGGDSSDSQLSADLRKAQKETRARAEKNEWKQQQKQEMIKNQLGHRDRHKRK